MVEFLLDYQYMILIVFSILAAVVGHDIILKSNCILPNIKYVLGQKHMTPENCVRK